MAKNQKLERIIEELNKTKNKVDTLRGYASIPEYMDEDSYYYYLVDSDGLYDLIPTQVTSSIIERLDSVDGLVDNPESNITRIPFLFTLRDQELGPQIQELVERTRQTYDSTTHLKYIEAAEEYALLRERLIRRIIENGDNTIMYQEQDVILGENTTQRFSLGYNEDSYIKSSIAYEIELYMRSLFSQYGLLDKDIKGIFSSHNLQTAFQKLPRTVRTRIFEIYKRELEAKANESRRLMLTKYLNLDKIGKAVEKIGDLREDPEDIEKVLCDSYEKYILLPTKDEMPNDIRTKMEEVGRILKQNNIELNVNKNVTSQKHTSIDSLQTKDYNNPTIKRYVFITKELDKYKSLEEQYKTHIESLQHINDYIKHLINLLEQVERTKRIEDGKRKNNHGDMTDIEYEKLECNISLYNDLIEKAKEKAKSIFDQIHKLETEMLDLIFKGEYANRTSYQDNRYTYEENNNNNYENMLIFLKAIKQVAVGPLARTVNYDNLFFRELDRQNAEGGQRVTISTQLGNIEVFKDLFSRRDVRFTCEGRQTKEGQISKFFPSKQDKMLDALYSAELRYLGALEIKDEDERLFMAEAALSSELYLKSLLGVNEVTHELGVLYSKLSEEYQDEIYELVCNTLNEQMSKDEFIDMLNHNLINNAFREFRYLYEKNNVEEQYLSFLSAFVNALHQVSAKKLSYTSPYYDAIEVKTGKDNQDNQSKNI